MAKPGEVHYEGEYKDRVRDRNAWKDRMRNSPDRFVSIVERDDTSLLSHNLFKKIERGKYRTDWRGVPISKDPLDLVIYQALLWEIKPRTVVELGTMAGGSALWLADHVHMFGLACHVIEFDRDFSDLHEKARHREGITYLQGDSNEIEKTFTPEMLQAFPHPWIIIEDAHVNVKNVLELFYTYMTSGDYSVVEDGHPSVTTNVVNIIRENDADGWGMSKMSVLRNFLLEHSNDLMVDKSFTDFFGHNMTFNINGFIRKM